MNQKSRPVSDLVTGAWTPTPIYPQVNGAVGDGEVASGATPAGDSFDVKLVGLAWPKKWRDADPEQTLTVIQGRTEFGDLPATITLLQGDLVIAAQEVDDPGVVDLNLTHEEVEKITDYQALSVRVTAGKPVVGCCPSALPTTVTATLGMGTGCSLLDGLTFPLSWNSARSAWRGGIMVCGMLFWIEVDCLSTPSGYSFSYFGGWGDSVVCTNAFGRPAEPGTTCDPLVIRFLLDFFNTCPCCPLAAHSTEIVVTQ